MTCYMCSMMHYTEWLRCRIWVIINYHFAGENKSELRAHVSCTVQFIAEMR